MKRQLWAWINTTLRSLREQQTVGMTMLPNPSSLRSRLPVGMVDPTTTIVLVAAAQSGGYEAPGAYVGLVGQEPHGRWRGLTGFYAPWCPGCDADGDAMFRGIRSGLEARDVRVRSVWDLPAGLHPRDGWFDQERLKLGGFVDQRPGLTDTWEVVGGTPTHGPAAVATGPSTASLSNIVLVRDLSQDLAELARLLPRGRWTTRPGADAALARLLGVDGSKPSAIHTMRSRDVPATWGVWRGIGEKSWNGPVPNLRAHLAAAEGARPSTSPVEVRHLTPERPARLKDILSLAPGRSTRANTKRG
jgi:hypothetical protein